MLKLTPKTNVKLGLGLDITQKDKGFSSLVCGTMLATGVILAMTAAPSQAANFRFNNITNNNSGDAAIGEAQLSMEVTQDNGKVLFEIFNTGSEQLEF